MTTDVSFADSQTYLQHFRNRGCASDIVDNTEGLFNLLWHNYELIDQLKQELERKTVNIVRLQEMVFGPGAIAQTPDSEGSDDPPDAIADTDEPAPDQDQKKKSTEKPKGHGRRGVND